MGKFENKKALGFIFLCGALLGVVIFLCIYGYNVIDVTNDNWLLNGEDINQNYLGWKFFRESNWSFPFGLIEGLTYPNKISIIYTDSIPIFAIIFKLLSPILPETFQYFGIWGLICFILQGGLSGIIIRKYTKSNIIPIIASIFFIVSPTVLQRMFGHTALAGQWIILCAIGICVYKEYFNTFLKNLIVWSLLISIAVSVHMYFVPMIVLIMFFYFIKKYIDKKIILYSIFTIMISILSALFVMYILGAFYGNSDIKQIGYGVYSANLNTLFNPQGTSNFIINLPTATVGQYEGYAYLGLGIIILIVISLFGIIKRYRYDKNQSIKNKIKNNSDLILIWVLILILIIFAASSKISLNSNIIFDIKISDKLLSFLSIFRATGRFMWPVMYIIMILVIKNIISNYKREKALILLIFCCIVQLMDLSNYIIAKHDIFSKKTEYKSQLQSSVWAKLADNYKDIIFINKINSKDASMLINYYNLKTILDIGNFAINNDMLLNDFYIGRRDSSFIADYSYGQLLKLQNGEADKKNLYIFNSIPLSLLKDNKLNFYEIDGLIIGCVNAIEDVDNNNFIKLEINNNIFNVINGEETNNETIIYKDEIIYGPKISIDKGTYRVIIHGNNLDESTYDVSYDGGLNFIEKQVISKTTNEIEFMIQLNDNIENSQIIVKNIGDEPINIEDIILRLE